MEPEVIVSIVFWGGLLLCHLQYLYWVLEPRKEKKRESSKKARRIGNVSRR